MPLILKTPLLRRLLLLVELGFFLVLLSWLVRTYVADLLAQKPTAKNLEIAVQLDSNNPEYHLKLGRVYQYNVPDAQPEKALQHFRRAVGLSPFDAQGWLELAAALELRGNTLQAETCLRQADSLAPHIPSIQWAIGTVFLLHGNTDEAFRHFKVVLKGTREFDPILFDTAWKASGNPDKILDLLIPRDLPTEFSYLYYLISLQHFAEAKPVWNRILNSSEKFTPQRSAGYIDSLISSRQPQEAHRVWTDLQRKGLVRNPSSGSHENLLSNGDFEDELLNMGFDWRVVRLEGVYTGLDQTFYQSPSHALLVRFSGKQNLDYRQVYQYVKVSPGRSYRLQAFLRSEGITTDSGPRLEVRDAYDPAALDKFSEDLRGTTSGWTSLMLDFTTGPKTELVLVGLSRLPSHKLDNLIAGKVWLDDVSLTPVSEQGTRLTSR